MHHHRDWGAFQQQRQGRGGRLGGLGALSDGPYTAYTFSQDDWLLFGRETDGLPADVQAECDALLTIPMARPRTHPGGGVRSLNLASAVAIVLFEALRQLDSGQS